MSSTHNLFGEIIKILILKFPSQGFLTVTS